MNDTNIKALVAETVEKLTRNIDGFTEAIVNSAIEFSIDLFINSNFPPEDAIAKGVLFGRILIKAKQHRDGNEQHLRQS